MAPYVGAVIAVTKSRLRCDRHHRKSLSARAQTVRAPARVSEKSWVHFRPPPRTRARGVLLSFRRQRKTVGAVRQWQSKRHQPQFKRRVDFALGYLGPRSGWGSNLRGAPSVSARPAKYLSRTPEPATAPPAPARQNCYTVTILRRRLKTAPQPPLHKWL